MMKKNDAYLIKNVRIVNENCITATNVWIEDTVIKEIGSCTGFLGTNIINGQGNYLLPGVIDDQVHFREPGLMHKGEIATESKAAVAGGVTSYMEMPNTSPPTLTQEALEAKYALAAEKSAANYSFYMGASNENLEEVLKTDPSTVCGIKVFMGSSTGNMLVDNIEVLSELFKKSKLLIATHCEDEATVKQNTLIYKDKYGENPPIEVHPLIRSEEACYLSSSLAVGLAKKFGTRLHVLHVSTAKELELFETNVPLAQKRITAEVCVHHLWFSDKDYTNKGTAIKWNPAIKTEKDRLGLMQGLLNDRLDVVATDHAPHTWDEKQNSYFKAPSGGPLVQHSLLAMLEFVKQDVLPITKVVEKMCHAPAIAFNVKQRGFIREGYKADLVLVDMNNKTEITKENILYKCGWSPFEGLTFGSKITHTFVNGNLVYENGQVKEGVFGERLLFNR